MKNKALFLLFFCAWASVLPAQILKFTPEHPKQGEPVKFEYDLAKSPLHNVANEVTVRALEFSDGGDPESRPVMSLTNENILTGMILPGQEALGLALVFEAGERLDNNNGEGYYVHLYGGNGKPLPESRAARVAFHGKWGYLFELESKPAVFLSMLDAEFADNPGLKKTYTPQYVQYLLAVKRGDDGKKMALELLDQLAGDPAAPEKSLMSAVKMFDRMQEGARANAVKERLRKDFPQGMLVQQERQAAIQLQTDLPAREKMIEEYVRTFPPQTDADRDAIDQLWSRLATKLADQKQWEPFKTTSQKLRPAARASLYNNIAWDLAEHGEDLAQAKILAAEAATWAKGEMENPVAKKPLYETPTRWQRARAETFAGYADTYAFVLDKNGDAVGAASWQEQVVTITEGKVPDMNERLAGYLERAKSPDLRYRLEGFIRQGQATGEMKNQFKRLYASEYRSEAGTAAYLAGLEKVAKNHRREELAAEMLDRPAPVFSLKNLDGETVSLESLRGKVVIVDFWATWCGPCKASFPGMQTMVNQYKDDAQVAFVFVDTWERTGDVAKNAADFIHEKGYPFNVLLDLENKVVADYGVSGIPTKFVVDKTGRIRFKSVGFGGSADGLVEELNLMIELTKAQP